MWNRPNYYTVHNVEKLGVGHQVEDALFRFEFPPGTEVRDQVRQRFYRVGKSGEELDLLVGRGREELAESQSIARVWLLLFNAAIVVALALFFGYRLLRQNRSVKSK
jgi:hypothetical protein